MPCVLIQNKVKHGGTVQIVSNMVKFNFFKGYYINPEDIKIGIVSNNPHRAMDAYIKYLIKKHLDNI